MKQIVIAAVAVLAVVQAWAVSPADFSAVDAKLNACSDQNPNNYGVSNCTMAAKATADQRLNDIYGGLVNALKHPKGPDNARDDSEILKRLIAAERAWIAFRDAECNYQSTVALGGTGEGVAYVTCLYMQTKERVKILTAPDVPQNAR
ncbi:lysozyme inhibitor LprI family protein [uncultured Caballeronia sp.]|uniref:lysozyme inhibitor LprI family protein n=1 Tax=uncultured Caballeronia sp. TaxID=1827198 RepID=UPI0035CA9AE4